jgi:hypothetical protein
MKTKRFLFYVLAILLGGCIPLMSLHPLYTEKDLAFDGKLFGTWVDDSNETIWQFTDANPPEGPSKGKVSPKADKPEKAYKLIFTDKEGKKGAFIAHLVILENKLFLDVYPGESPWGDEDDPNKVEWLYNTLFLIPVHTFIRVNGIDPQLKLQITDDEEFKKLLKEDPNAIEHTSIEDKLVLTASTKELQAFVLKYAGDSRLFTEESILTRKKTKAPQGSVRQKSNEPNEPNKG